MRGCKMRSSTVRRSGSSNTRVRRRPRSRVPSGCSTSSPPRSTLSCSASLSGDSTSRATTAASIPGTPRRSKYRATVDLPLPMPPVRPMMSMPLAYGARRASASDLVRKEGEITRGKRVAQQQREPAGRGEIRSERNGDVAIAAAGDDEREADGCADHARQQHDHRQALPAHPGAQHREQLEIAVAHAFFAGRPVEQDVGRPETEIAGRGADDAGGAVYEYAMKAE